MRKLRLRAVKDCTRPGERHLVSELSSLDSNFYLTTYYMNFGQGTLLH